MTAKHDTAHDDAGGPSTMTLQLGNDPADALRIPLPAGAIPAEDILPTIHTIADLAASRAAAAAQARGRPISCKSGCAACCRQLVTVSDIEARVLAGVVARMPEPRRTVVQGRFKSACRRMTEAGIAGTAFDPLGSPAEDRESLAARYFGLRIDCPFLEAERCSIYDDRPLTCRQVLVTTPAAHCSDPDHNRIESLRMPMLARTLFVFTSDDQPPRPALVPLPFALDWAASHGTDPRRREADWWMQRFVSRLVAT
jgi:Fe-S-cluster containining protein